MTVSASGSTVSVNGLVSGINTQQVITALLQGYQIPITDLENRQSAAKSQAGDYQTVNSDMQALLNAAQSLNTGSSWNLMTASTSNSSVAGATASAGATPGSLAFTVNGLAQGNVLASQGVVASEGQVVTTAPSFLVATGGAALGFSALGASGGLSLGAHSLAVTQSSQAASLSGGAAAGSATTITTGTNDSLDVSVNGSAYVLTLGAGTYTPSQLVTAIDQAATTAGAPLAASIGDNGNLQLSSLRQGARRVSRSPGVTH